MLTIFGFHIFMSTTNLPLARPFYIALALLFTALWLIVFFRMRSACSGVFVERVP